jgi:hypothetical protein
MSVSAPPFRPRATTATGRLFPKVIVNDPASSPHFRNVTVCWCHQATDAAPRSSNCESRELSFLPIRPTSHNRNSASTAYAGGPSRAGRRIGRSGSQDAADDPERIAIREALAFGKALYDIRTALGLSVAELAVRAAMTDDDIERIEEGGTEPTIPLLRRLAAALNADVRLTGGHDLGSVWFETHAA